MRTLDEDPDDLAEQDPAWMADMDPASGQRARRSFVRGLLTGFVIGGVLGVGLAVLVGFAAVGWMLESGQMPDTMAQRGEEIPEAALELLQERAIIDEGEEVLYYYSGGFLSFSEDGNLFTDRQVVSYWEDDEGEFHIQAATYPEIAGMEVDYDEAYLADSTIRVQTVDDEEIVLYVSNEDDRDEEFYELLRSTWEARR